MSVQRSGQFVNIAQSREKPSPCDQNVNDGHRSQNDMPYACQPCVKRKIKCDKATPLCTSCRKGNIECFYQAPQPRKRKREAGDETRNKLYLYQRILYQHGLLPQEGEDSSEMESEPIQPSKSDLPELGRLVTDRNRSRYIDSRLWCNVSPDEIDCMDETEDDDQQRLSSYNQNSIDPLTGAFVGSMQNLHEFYPTKLEVSILRKIYTENVEPICKILHVPTIAGMLDMKPSTPLSSETECLLFAMSHFAVFSISDDECLTTLGQPRDVLMQRFNFATRQALVNAAFLKTSVLSVLQSLVLFLIPCRYYYDSQTYWILTGIASRISQRMGLHRDGEKLGLPPFEVELKRRLFYQIIPLDGIAGEMAGINTIVMSGDWDTEQPLNINDDQIWPGMMEKPTEGPGATDMIFCLTRSTMGRLFMQIRKCMPMSESAAVQDYATVESMIDRAEGEVEEKFIRYCDIVNPLHFLTIALARSAIDAMRLRVGLAKMKGRLLTDKERASLFRLSQKILETDSTAYAHANVKRYMWHVKPFFAWGSWDSLIFLLTTLRDSDYISKPEAESAWNTVEQVFSYHGELLESRRVLHTAVGRLAIKAWDANTLKIRSPERPFITTLRQTFSPVQTQTKPDAVAGPSSSPTIINNIDDVNGSWLESADWTFWDEMIKSYETAENTQLSLIEQLRT